MEICMDYLNEYRELFHFNSVELQLDLNILRMEQPKNISASMELIYTAYIVYTPKRIGIHTL